MKRMGRVLPLFAAPSLGSGLETVTRLGSYGGLL